MLLHVQAETQTGGFLHKCCRQLHMFQILTLNVQTSCVALGAASQTDLPAVSHERNVINMLAISMQKASASGDRQKSFLPLSSHHQAVAFSTVGFVPLLPQAEGK